ncbi:MAG: AAA family ATPase [Proteobacteria bacterium]|nr:AAA family ATPase [Pseudomonadota bacterium]
MIKKILYQLITRVRYYFLLRPRHCGKSLLLSTFKYLFPGEQELLQGLYIEDIWDSSTKYPVLRLNFDGKYHESGDLHSHILEEWHQKIGQLVMVLVDEYGKPFLDSLNHLNSP